jgi:hypothetical protein
MWTCVNAAINMSESLYLAFVLAQSAHPTGRRPSGVQIRHWRRHRGEILGDTCLGVAHGLGGGPPHGLPAERGDGLNLDSRFQFMHQLACRVIVSSTARVTGPSHTTGWPSPPQGASPGGGTWIRSGMWLYLTGSAPALQHWAWWNVATALLSLWCTPDETYR